MAVAAIKIKAAQILIRAALHTSNQTSWPSSAPDSTFGSCRLVDYLVAVRVHREALARELAEQVAQRLLGGRAAADLHDALVQDGRVERALVGVDLHLDRGERLRVGRRVLREVVARQLPDQRLHGALRVVALADAVGAVDRGIPGTAVQRQTDEEFLLLLSHCDSLLACAAKPRWLMRAIIIAKKTMVSRCNGVYYGNILV